MARASQETPVERAEISTDELDDRVLRSLRQIIRSVDLYSKKLSRDHTLTGPQLLCLRYLVGAGPQPVGAVAHAMSLSPATVTGVLDRLEDRGLVVRERSQTDRRQVLNSATASGRELVAGAPPPLDESFTSRLHALPRESQERIAAVLDEIVAMMGATDLDAAPILTPGSEIGEAAGAASADDS